MKTELEGRFVVCAVLMLSLGILGGCAHMEKAPKDRPGYLYYHKPLPEAARVLDEARKAGKDKECPAEFEAAKGLVDKAFETYKACYTNEGMAMAQDAIKKVGALCPPKPVAIAKPSPKPEVKPQPEPKPATASAGQTAVVTSDLSKIKLEDVRFDFNKATLTKEAVAILKRNIKVLQDNPRISLQIEGHACAHGSDTHNMALGERRAAAIKEYLIREGKIAPARLSTISYGKTRLAMPEKPTPKNKNSKEAKANRRVHFEVIVK